MQRRPLLRAALAGPALLSAAASPALLTAATRAAMAQDPRKVVRSVPIGDLRALDPIWTTTYLTRNHAYLVWDTLFALDAQNRPQPQMVGGFETSGDGLTWTFQLRPGLLWHDDTPVRAADCVASIRRWGARDGMGRALMAQTEALEARDDRTFVLRAEAPRRLRAGRARQDRQQRALHDAGAPGAHRPEHGDHRSRGLAAPSASCAQEWVPGVKVVYERNARYVPRDEPPSQAAGGKVVKIDRVESALHAGRRHRRERPADRRVRPAGKPGAGPAGAACARRATSSSRRTIRSATRCSW